MEGNENGQSMQPKAVVCEARRKPNDFKSEKPHCWHAHSSPIRNPNASILFPSVCCWCAPAWMHLDVFVPAQVPDTEIVAAQMEHGSLITIKKMPRQGLQLVMPDGR